MARQSEYTCSECGAKKTSRDPYRKICMPCNKALIERGRYEKTCLACSEKFYTNNVNGERCSDKCNRTLNQKNYKKSAHVSKAFSQSKQSECLDCGLKCRSQTSVCRKCQALRRLNGIESKFDPQFGRKKTCQDCGDSFVGGPNAMYCVSCRSVRIDNYENSNFRADARKRIYGE